MPGQTILPTRRATRSGPSGWLLRLLAAAFLVLLLPSTALAAEPRPGDTVVVGPNEVIDDDLYAFGGTVTVEGTVNGDLVALGGTITVNGLVTGDLIAAGGTTTIAGEVRGSVRAVGGTVVINGPVREDVLVGGGMMTLGPAAQVGRDLYLGAGAATVSGSVGRNVVAGLDTLTLTGPVGGDVRAEVETLRVTESAAIAGNLTYAANQAEIAPTARVQGTVVRGELPPGRVERGPAARAGDLALGWVRALIGLGALGLLLVGLFPRATRRVRETLVASPWPSLGLGFALLVGVPLVAGLVFVVGLFVGGWWLSLILVALYVIALVLAYLTAGLFVGRWILERAGRPGLHQAWGLLIGLVVLTLIGLVPVIGGLVGLAAVLFGLGALALTTINVYRGPRTPVPAGDPGWVESRPGEPAPDAPRLAPGPSAG